MALQYEMAYEKVDASSDRSKQEKMFNDIAGVDFFSIKDSRAGWYRLAVETVALEIAALAV